MEMMQDGKLQNDLRKWPSKKGMDVQIALLPGRMDPDDYITQYGGEAFREKVIGNPHSYMSFMMAYAKRSKNLSL